MRKLLALALVAVLSTTVALAVVGCGKKAEETPADTSTSTMSTDSSMMADTSMNADSTMMK
jgi:hypothetical protein